MEDLIDKRNRMEKCNIIKREHYTYTPLDEKPEKEEKSEESAADILKRINQDKENKLMSAIQAGKEV